MSRGPVFIAIVVVTGGVAYVTTITPGVVTLQSVGLASGAATTIGDFGVDFSLLGANDEAIFYTQDQADFVRRDLATGVVSSLPIPMPAHAILIDRDHVYVDSVGRTAMSFPAVVARVPSRGGDPEVIYRADERDGIQAIAGDDCAVYFAAGPDYNAPQAPAIFALRK